MLEIHYDNPHGIKCRHRYEKKECFPNLCLTEISAHDRSGFRVHYTEELRANDGGIMITGVSISDTQLIPPGQKLYRNVGICGPSCTNVVSKLNLNYDLYLFSPYLSDVPRFRYKNLICHNPHPQSWTKNDVEACTQWERNGQNHRR